MGYNSMNNQLTAKEIKLGPCFDITCLHARYKHNDILQKLYYENKLSTKDRQTDRRKDNAKL
jgi:hypothetical protein